MTFAQASTPSITGATRLLGFIGDPVIHAKSPQNFNPLLAGSGHNAVLVPIHIPQDRFDETIGGVMSIANLDGLIVTMPFKERLMTRLDDVSRRAQAIGAVNAARRMLDGRWVGDIFDGVGLVGAVESIGVLPKGLTVGLIGAGGAGSAIAFALAEAEVSSLTIVDRNRERAQSLCGRVAEYSGLRPSTGELDFKDLDLLVHATPVGMLDSDGIAVDISGLSGRTTVIDIVTRPDTPLLRSAAQIGCRCASGGEMVKAQTRAILSYLGYRHG
jgi:shikimate dehydrogenase